VKGTHDFELLKAYLEPRLRLIEQALEEALPPTSLKPSTLHEAMRYAVLCGGKRMRPLLCIASAEACKGNSENVLPIACALELIHAFSLVHDDLPALDNDTLRRGQPTCHIQFGEATALLAGDALFAKAFELIAQQAQRSRPEQVLEVLELIAHAIGTQGMVGGQIEDMRAENGAPTCEDLDYIHGHKTGALIRAAVLSGAILSGGIHPQKDALDRYSRAVGHAFQVIDDILNETGDSTKLGKAVGSDRERRKATYPRLFGLKQSQKIAQKRVQEAIEALHAFGQEADPLRWIALYTLQRDR
jgi:geranylgeranyl diphosphate synthase type II